MTENRRRNIQVKFRVTRQEQIMIMEKMKLAGIQDMGAYLRKMAIDGYTVTLNLPEIKEMLRLLRYMSNNLNQLARRVHESRRVYDTDIDDLIQRHVELKDDVRKLLDQLGKLS